MKTYICFLCERVYNEEETPKVKYDKENHICKECQKQYNIGDYYETI